MLRGYTLAIGGLTLAAACGSDVTLTGSASGSAGASSTAGVGGASTNTSSSATGAGGGNEDCCPADEVLRNHPCLPTTELGCGASCRVDTCPVGRRCDACAATGPCAEKSCQAACVLDESGPGFAIQQGDLRIAPTRIDSGQPTWVSVMGVPLYVGALWFGVRVGAVSEHMLQGEMSIGPCEQAFLSDALAPADYPVWVSQYGGGDAWILAGFLSVSDQPLTCTQPGYACSADTDCCRAPSAAVDCVSGRCMYTGG